MRTSLFLLLLFPALWGFAQSQRPERVAPATGTTIVNQFEHLSVKDGLSHNSVTCILQDREGFIWFGTNDGLNKYDGYSFTTLLPDRDRPTQSFLNSRITGLCEDQSGRLWAVTEGGGLHEVNKQTGLVTPHPIQGANAHGWNNQLSVYEDKQGILWLGTFAGLARYDPDRHSFKLYPSPTPEAYIKTVFEDSYHRFWAATLRGLYLFDRSTGRFTLLSSAVAPGTLQPTFISFYQDHQDILWLGTAGMALFKLDLRRQPWQLVPYNPGGQLQPFVYMNSVHADAQGTIWVGTTNGLQRIDPVTNQVFTFRPDPNAPKGISSNNTQAVYHDRAGTLWVGTDNGIDRQALNAKPFVTYQVTPNKGTANLPSNKIIALLLDSQDRLWLSTGYTLQRLATDRKHLETIPPEKLGGLKDHQNYIHTLLNNGAEGIWLGTWEGLYQYDQASGRYTAYPSEVPAQYICYGPTGTIWLGGEGGLASFDTHTHRYTYYIYKPNAPNGLPDKYIQGLLVSRTSDVWALVKRQGIWRLNPQTGRTIRYVAGPKGHLSTNEVQTIHEDKTGIIWIGTHQGGLNRFDPKTGLFTVITPQDGLPDNSIAGITSDNSGRLWLSTFKGLCRYDPRTKAIQTYEMTDGLPSNDFIENAVFRTRDRIYFGSLNGVVHFSPDSIHTDTRPFPVYITGFKVLNQPRHLSGRSITLSHNENFISFEFAALTYGLSDQNQYAYQLVGIDKDWVQNGNLHVANYTNLSPGTYRFRVKASNSDGIWNEQGAAIDLIILPPWWATWWAYGLFGLIAVGTLWGIIRFYVNRIHQRQELELNRREAQQLKAVDELKSRFFSNITHEFRTPLSLIIAPVEKLLQQNQFDVTTRQTLSLIQRNANQLLRLINQLLDLSKLEARSMGVSLMRGDVPAFVGHLLESFQQAIDQKGISLTFTHDNFPHDYLFDADKWQKILANLLSNAVKFTGHGGSITVTLQPELSADTGIVTGAHIRITDTGIGISPTHIPHIFDRFYQVDDSRTRSYEGTGIGLALVKDLIELIGGTIGVESELDRGTNFSLLLPVQPATLQADVPTINWTQPAPAPALNNAAVPVTTTPATHQATDEAPLILVVEDNAELRDFLVSELSITYQVLSAPNGEIGWQLAQSELPDIVISDLMMPKLDGYELTRLIKNHPDTDHIAVVILTAKAAYTSRIEGLQEGADDYLAKPFHFDELHLRLHNLIARQQKLREEYRQQLNQPGTPANSLLAQDPFLQRIYELLEKNIDDSSLNVDWLASQLAMSRKTLYRKVHNLIQLAPNELIRQYRLHQAANLLRSGRTVAETAYMVVFKTPSHFTLVFKEFYQQTPTEFILVNLKNA